MTNPSIPVSSKIIPLRGFTSEQFLVIAVGILQELDWEIDSVSDHGIIAFTNPATDKGKVKVTIRIERFTAEISSGCTIEETETHITLKQKAILDYTSALYNSKCSYSSKELAERYEELKPFLIQQVEDTSKQESDTFKESKAEILSVFKPRDLLAGMKDGNTNNAAHIGGLISGVIIGYLLYPGLKAREG